MNPLLSSWHLWSIVGSCLSRQCLLLAPNRQDVLEEILIPRLEVDAGRKPHIVRYIITKKLEQFTRFRRSIFERVYAISENVATLMIQTGYKQPSRFGRWCPVKVWVSLLYTYHVGCHRDCRWCPVKVWVSLLYTYHVGCHRDCRLRLPFMRLVSQCLCEALLYICSF